MDHPTVHHAQVSSSAVDADSHAALLYAWMMESYGLGDNRGRKEHTEVQRGTTPGSGLRMLNLK